MIDEFYKTNLNSDHSTEQGASTQFNTVLLNNSEDDLDVSQPQASPQKASQIVLNSHSTNTTATATKFELVYNRQSDLSDSIEVQPVQSSGNQFLFFLLPP